MQKHVRQGGRSSPVNTLTKPSPRSPVRISPPHVPRLSLSKLPEWQNESQCSSLLPVLNTLGEGATIVSRREHCGDHTFSGPAPLTCPARSTYASGVERPLVDTPIVSHGPVNKRRYEYIATTGNPRTTIGEQSTTKLPVWRVTESPAIGNKNTKASTIPQLTGGVLHPDRHSLSATSTPFHLETRLVSRGEPTQVYIPRQSIDQPSGWGRAGVETAVARTTVRSSALPSPLTARSTGPPAVCEAPKTARQKPRLQRGQSCQSTESFVKTTRLNQYPSPLCSSTVQTETQAKQRLPVRPTQQHAEVPIPPSQTSVFQSSDQLGGSTPTWLQPTPLPRVVQTSPGQHKATTAFLPSNPQQERQVSAPPSQNVKEMPNLVVAKNPSSGYPPNDRPRSVFGRIFSSIKTNLSHRDQRISDKMPVRAGVSSSTAPPSTAAAAVCADQPTTRPLTSDGTKEKKGKRIFRKKTTNVGPSLGPTLPKENHYLATKQDVMESSLPKDRGQQRNDARVGDPQRKDEGKRERTRSKQSHHDHTVVEVSSTRHKKTDQSECQDRNNRMAPSTPAIPKKENDCEQKQTSTKRVLPTTNVVAVPALTTPRREENRSIVCTKSEIKPVSTPDPATKPTVAAKGSEKNRQNIQKQNVLAKEQEEPQDQSANPKEELHGSITCDTEEGTQATASLRSQRLGNIRFSWRLSRALVRMKQYKSEYFKLNGVPFTSWEMKKIPTLGASPTSCRVQEMYKACVTANGHSSKRLFIKVVPVRIWMQQWAYQNMWNGQYVTDGENFVMETATLAFLNEHGPWIAPKLIAVLEISGFPKGDAKSETATTRPARPFLNKLGTNTNTSNGEVTHMAIVSELYGEDLLDFLDHREKTAPLTLKEKKQLQYDCLRLMADLHKLGFAHLDFTPENVLVGEEGLKLCDFAKATPLWTQNFRHLQLNTQNTDASNTATQQVWYTFESCEPTVGKGAYMPPECWKVYWQLEKAHIQYPLTELWSLRTPDAREPFYFRVDSADVYMLGVLFFWIWSEGGIWRCSDPSQDEKFHHLIQNKMNFDIFRECRSWQQTLKAMLLKTLNPDTKTRLHPSALLRHPWFADVVPSSGKPCYYITSDEGERQSNDGLQKIPETVMIQSDRNDMQSHMSTANVTT